MDVVKSSQTLCGPRNVEFHTSSRKEQRGSYLGAKEFQITRSHLQVLFF